MSFDAHANFALANITVAPTPATSGNSFTVDDASLFPVPPYNAVCWPPTVLPTYASAEIVRVTSSVSNVMTLLRAQEGSQAQALAVGYQIAAPLTAKILTDIESAISALSTGGGDSGAFNLAHDAYAIAVIGTNLGTVAYNLASEAFQIACIGTNTGTVAYQLAQEAFRIACIGTNTGSYALSVATSGSNQAMLLTNWFGTVHSVPTGGTTGQVLAKASNTNWDAVWTTASSGTGGSTGTFSGTFTGTTVINNYFQATVMDIIQVQVFS